MRSGETGVHSVRRRSPLRQRGFAHPGQRNGALERARPQRVGPRTAVLSRSARQTPTHARARSSTSSSMRTSRTSSGSTTRATRLRSIASRSSAPTLGASSPSTTRACRTGPSSRSSPSLTAKCPSSPSFLAEGAEGLSSTRREAGAVLRCDQSSVSGRQQQRVVIACAIAAVTRPEPARRVEAVHHRCEPLQPKAGTKLPQIQNLPVCENDTAEIS